MAIYDLNDLLVQRFVLAGAFGFDKINDSIQARLEWLNGQVNEQIGIFAEVSEDARRIWGGSSKFEMHEIDEFGVARTQKATSGVEVNFPLRKFSVSTGFTADYLRRATVAEIAQVAINAQEAYLERMQSELKFALYNKDNYSFVDKFGDGSTLAVKAFLNADSVAIPNAPDGTEFDSSNHSHYSGTIGASLAVADIDALIENVTEHGLTKGVALFINAGNVSTLLALSGTKFVKLTSALLVPANDTVSTVARINPEADLNNVLIGFWDGRVPVYTRSWGVSGYYVCVATGAAEKPLILRTDKYVKGLVMDYELGAHPISAKTWSAYVGMGANNRASVAVLDSAHQTDYTEPTLIR
jgi:peptidoglycan hydrolase-like protein with peptidoglycan-binding domain